MSEEQRGKSPTSTRVNLASPPDAPESSEKAEADEMSLMDHLTELRARLLYCVLALFFGASVAFIFSKELFGFITDPFFIHFPPNSLIGTGPAEAFLLRLKVSIFAAIIVCSPFLFLQVWLFVAPGLYESEKRLALPFVLATSLLFLGGAWLCYRIVLPLAFEFFVEQYSILEVTPQIRVSEALSFILRILIAFGVVFELPVATFFFARAGIVTSKQLIAWFPYAVVITFIAAAVLTPPDVLTQALLAIPVLVLYGVSILVAKVAYPGEVGDSVSDSPESEK